MARETFEDWIPVEFGDQVLEELAVTSVVESLASPVPMSTDTKQIPRAGDFAIAAVAKGAAYGETSGTNDYVEMIARKIGGIARIAEEDLTMSPVDILGSKRRAAARNMAKFFDNAALASTGAADGSNRLYTSVYQAVRTNDSATSYTADTNYLAGALTYDNLSTWLSKYEESPFFDESSTTLVAAPAYRAAFRGIKDSHGDPILVDMRGNSSAPSTLFGYPIRWSMGARVAAVNTYAPTGNPLLIAGNWNLAFKGMAKLSPYAATPNPGFAIQRASQGMGFLTDEALLKAAMSRAFVLGYPRAFTVFEKTS